MSVLPHVLSCLLVGFALVVPAIASLYSVYTGWLFYTWKHSHTHPARPENAARTRSGPALVAPAPASKPQRKPAAAPLLTRRYLDRREPLRPRSSEDTAAASPTLPGWRHVPRARTLDAMKLTFRGNGMPANAEKLASGGLVTPKLRAFFSALTARNTRIWQAPQRMQFSLRTHRDQPYHARSTPFIALTPITGEHLIRRQAAALPFLWRAYGPEAPHAASSGSSTARPASLAALFLMHNLMQQYQLLATFDAGVDVTVNALQSRDAVVYASYNLRFTRSSAPKPKTAPSPGGLACAAPTLTISDEYILLMRPDGAYLLRVYLPACQLRAPDYRAIHRFLARIIAAPAAHAPPSPRPEAAPRLAHANAGANAGSNAPR